MTNAVNVIVVGATRMGMDAETHSSELEMLNPASGAPLHPSVSCTTTGAELLYCVVFMVTLVGDNAMHGTASTLKVAPTVREATPGTDELTVMVAV